MNVIDTALDWVLTTAKDNSHGYDQSNRWGPNYDCSSLIISAFKKAGISLSCTYTGNMFADMTEHGFTDVTSRINLFSGLGLIEGDVLLNHKSHTALYIGNGQIVQASINEKGTVSGGMSGDQTGKEIGIRSYYNYPWDCVLRYTGESIKSNTNLPKTTISITIPQVEDGDEGVVVAMLQAALKYRGFDPVYVDGEFGLYTHNMLMGFQAERGLTTDAVAGTQTWKALIK